MSNKVLFIVLCVLMLLAGGLSVDVFCQQNFRETIAKKPVSVLETLEQREQTDTSDWKTYRNGKMGFEVDIPGNWQANEGFDLVQLGPASHDFSIEINVSSTSSTFVALLDNTASEHKVLEIDGTRAIGVFDHEPRIVVIKNRRWFRITVEPPFSLQADEAEKELTSFVRRMHFVSR